MGNTDVPVQAHSRSIDIATVTDQSGSLAIMKTGIARISHPGDR